MAQERRPGRAGKGSGGKGARRTGRQPDGLLKFLNAPGGCGRPRASAWPPQHPQHFLLACPPVQHRTSASPLRRHATAAWSPRASDRRLPSTDSSWQQEAAAAAMPSPTKENRALGSVRRGGQPQRTLLPARRPLEPPRWRRHRGTQAPTSSPNLHHPHNLPCRPPRSAARWAAPRAPPPASSRRRRRRARTGGV